MSHFSVVSIYKHSIRTVVLHSPILTPATLVSIEFLADTLSILQNTPDFYKYRLIITYFLVLYSDMYILHGFAI